MNQLEMKRKEAEFKKPKNIPKVVVDMIDITNTKTDNEVNEVKEVYQIP